jgi:hypothetical protein
MHPLTSGNTIMDKVLSGGSLEDNPLIEADPTITSGRLHTPAAMMPGLQGFLLGVEGEIDTIDLDSYEIARDAQKAEDIRWNFVIMDRLPTWSDLERDLSIQSRSYMYYGTSGHEIIFMEDAAGFASAAIPPRQDFRVPGVPGTNCFPNTAPLLERTPVSEVRNRIEVNYSHNYLERGNFMRNAVATEPTSVAQFGEQNDPQGVYTFWAHGQQRGHSSYDAQSSVSGIAAFMAERFAFTRNRFRFTTAWIGHGLDRGGLVRVVFPVSTDAIRNVKCEVEDITVSPLNSERFDITARAVEAAQEGDGSPITVAFTWQDRFDLSDQWLDELPNHATWDTHWS